MFDQIGRYAESVATRAGQTRRGFLGLVGKGALGLATAVGGLLLVPDKAVATNCGGGCRYRCPDGRLISGACDPNCSCDPTIKFRNMICNFFSSTCANA
jgi:hypothetical protein